MVLTGKLFYSYFSPTGYVDNNPCNGGTGSTVTVQVCNVMTPTFPGTGVRLEFYPGGCPQLCLR